MDKLGLDNLFWLTVGLIFSVTLLGAIVRRIKKDRCLKLFHNYHITYLGENTSATWGDMFVTSQGFQIQFDQPYFTRRGFAKHGCLIYEADFGRAIALCRSTHGLSPQEQSRREVEIKRCVDPNLWHQLMRFLANMVNMVRDAITNTLSLFLGRFGGRGGAATVAKDQSGRITELGGSLLGLVGRAYEPLLERHLGKPVILQITLPDKTIPPITEFPGYLADYNEKFVSIVNPMHDPEETWKLTINETTELNGCRIEVSQSEIAVHCLGKDAILVRELSMGSSHFDLAVVLLSGQHLTLARSSAGPIQIALERTARLDLTCPRHRGKIAFVGSSLSDPKKGGGLAPDAECTKATGA